MKGVFMSKKFFLVLIIMLVFIILSLGLYTYINEKYYGYYKVFFTSLESDDTQKVKELLDKYQSLLKENNGDGKIPLHIAAK
jgi:hypothetical protein